MSRLTGSDAKGLMEAYQAVYAPQELTEEQVWEEVENWVNSLLEEGYDLSEYTWDEMYEAYSQLDEYAVPLIQAGLRAALPAIGRAALPAIGAATKLLQGRGQSKPQEPVDYGQMSPGSFQARTNKPKATKPPTGQTTKAPSPAAQPAAKPETVKPRPQDVNLNPVNAGVKLRSPGPKIEVSAPKSNSPKPETPKPELTAKDLGGEITRQSTTPGQSSAPSSTSAPSGGGSGPSGPRGPKLDPLQTLKDTGTAIKNLGSQTLGGPARERFFGTTRLGQAARGLGTTGAVGLDVRGNLSDPTGTTKSTTAQVGSIGPGTAGNALRAAGAAFGGDKPHGGPGIPRGAYETGKDLQKLGQRMLDQPKNRQQPASTPTPPTRTPSWLKKNESKVNDNTIINESPNWRTVPKSKEIPYSTLTLGTERKVFIPGLGWQFPTTARRDARAKGDSNWNRIPNPSQPAKPAKQPPAKQPPAQQPPAQQPPAQQPPAQQPQRLPVQSAAATPAQAPAPRPTAQPKIEKSPSGYAVGSVGGIKFERRAATGAELAAARKARDEAKAAGNTKGAELAAVKAGVGASKNPMKEETMKYDAYDLVLEYLFSQGHVETLEEANYVMLVMDAETIGSIVEGVMPEPIDPTAHNKSQRFATQQGKIRALESGAATSGEKSAAQSKLKGPQLPGV